MYREYVSLPSLIDKIFDGGIFTQEIDGVSRYIENPEYKKKQLESSIQSLENQIKSLTNILSEQQQLLENKRKELKNLESKK